MKKTVFALILIFTFLLNIHIIYADSDYYIKVNRVTNCVTIYDKSGESVKAMICSVGANNTTPLGAFNTSQQLRWHHLYGDEYGQYCTRIVDDILFHSVPYYTLNPGDLNIDNYNMLGQADSLGCVRLTVEDAKWIYDNCGLDTEVIIFDGTEDDDPLQRPDAIKFGERAPYTWDPTDPSEDNPYNSLGVKIVTEQHAKTIYQDSSQNTEGLSEYIRNGVTAYDTAGNEIDFSFETNADPSKSGSYEIIYTAEDALGRFDSLETMLTVLPSDRDSDGSYTGGIEFVSAVSSETSAENSEITITSKNKIKLLSRGDYENTEWLSGYLRGGVHAYDADGNETYFSLETDADPTKFGVYGVTYKAAGSSGGTAVLSTAAVVMPSFIIADKMGVDIETEQSVKVIYQNDSQNTSWLHEYLRNGVTAYSTAGDEIDFSVETDADMSKCGLYRVTYRAEDSTGRRADLNITAAVISPAVGSDIYAAASPYINTGIEIVTEKAFRIIYLDDEQYNDWLMESLCRNVRAYDEDGKEIGLSADGNIDQTKSGIYSLTYTAADDLGRIGTAKTKVYVIPQMLVVNAATVLSPTWADNPDYTSGISITTKEPVKLICRSSRQNTSWLYEYLRNGVSAVNKAGNEINFYIETDTNMTKPGIYSVTYTAEDFSGQEEILEKKALVVNSAVGAGVLKAASPESTADTSGIRIEMEKAFRVIYLDDEQYNDWLLESLCRNVKAYDSEENEIEFYAEGDIDQTKCGIYSLTYTAEDSEGRTAKAETKVYVLPQMILVNAAAALSPEWADNPDYQSDIRITAEKYVRTIYQNSYQDTEWLYDYLRYGISAYDAEGNELDFTVSTEADPSVSGVYDVIYTAEDLSGQKGKLKTVFIVLPSALIGNASMQKN
ncbi:MAG: L,D-transpeptidase family protein [Clostridiales bacterium]|nr:L,D-transpeptidase family protein [Clostridiales bacterium]